MKITNILVALIATISITTLSFAQDNLKIGVVNSEYIVGVYPKFREIEAQMNKEVENLKRDRVTWEKQMEKIQNLIMEQEGTLRAGATTFTEKRKMELMTSIDSLKQSFEYQVNERVAQDQEKLQNRKAELVSVVLEEVNEHIQVMGKERNYDIIFDSSNGTVVYAKDPDDLTELLLQKLTGKQ